MTTLIPLLQSIEPVTLGTRLGRRGQLTCTVDADGVEWAGRRAEFDQVTSLAYSTRARRLNVFQHRMERRIRIASGNDLLSLDVGRSFGANRDAEEYAIYSTVVASLHAQVEPRLRDEAIRAIAAGQTVRFGPLGITHDGLLVEHTTERLEWRQLPIAQLEGDQVVVRATIDHDDGPLCVIDMLAPGAVLLPELLAEATIPFT